MKDKVRRLPLIDYADLDRFEDWLEDMALRGLFYDHAGPVCITFRRGAPAPVRYRMEPAGSFHTAESQIYLRQQGWACLGRAGKWFVLYAAADPDAPELHTDPVVRSYGLDQAARSMLRYCAMLLAVTLLFLAAVVLPYCFFDWPVLSLIESPLAGNLLPVVMELLSLSLTVRAFAGFFRFKRRLRQGAALRRKGSWRRGARITAVTLLCSLVLLALSFASLWAYAALRWEGGIAGQERPFPLLSLPALEGNDALEPVVIALQDGTDYNNYIRFSWSLLAPEQYEVYQRMSEPDGSHACGLDLRWYRLSFPCLTAPLLDELVCRYTQHNYFPEEYRVTQLELPGFDRAVLAVDNDVPGQRLFLARDGRVVYLDYDGERDLLAQLEEIEQLFDFSLDP